MPTETDVKLARLELPIFQPIDIRKLLAEARQSSCGANLDDAIADAYNKHCRVQLAKLLRALGCDPTEKDFWRNAFVKLARIHHNLGGLVVGPARQISNASSWTAKDEALLLCGVLALTQLGMSERKAVHEIADNQIFPHAERRPSERLRGQATQKARRDALWQKFQRLKRKGRGPEF